jgi:hypothetical protein
MRHALESKEVGGTVAKVQRLMMGMRRLGPSPSAEWACFQGVSRLTGKLERKVNLGGYYIRRNQACGILVTAGTPADG